MINDSQINLKEVNISDITNDDLKKILDENLRLTQEIHVMTHKIKSYISFQKFMSFVYLVLIIGPIIFSIMYLPPILKQVMGQYSELLNPTNPAFLLDSVTSEIKKYK